MYELQTTVVVKDKQFHITNNGDFRMVLDCFRALNDEELGEDYRVLAALIIFYNEFNSADDLQLYDDYLSDIIHGMYRFFNCGQDDAPGLHTNRILIDWDKDATIVSAAVNNVAKKEIRELPYLHWWTFMGYYMSVGESVLSTVVSIRSKILSGKKLEKWEQEFRRDNPQYFNWKHTSIQDREDEKKIREIWSKGGK